MRFSPAHGLKLTAIFLFFYGCINLGPDYDRPDLGIETPSSYEYAPAGTGSLVIEDRWWEIFDDRELNDYVEEALRNNWDIKQAAERVLEFRARYVEVRADRFPEVDVSGLKDRRLVDGGEFNNNFIVDTYELTAPASFEVDLWSKLKKASQAAWADILQQEETRRTIAQTIVAETISLYLQMEAVERRLQIAEQSIKAFRDSLRFVETRYRRGLVSGQPQRDRYSRLGRELRDDVASSHVPRHRQPPLPRAARLARRRCLGPAR